MLVFEDDLKKIPKHTDADIAKGYLHRLYMRQLSLIDNATFINGIPISDYLKDILDYWEYLIRVM